MLSDISKAFSRWEEVDGVGARKVDEEFKPLVVEVAAPVREGEEALPGAASGRSTCNKGSPKTGIHGSL
jgi:hypothetical protein